MLLLASKFAVAQQGEVQFSRLDLSDGLSNNQITAIFKDEQGYMWFGTMAGLNRFDGYEFKNFAHNPRNSKSISDDFINSISELPANKLLIDTRLGLNIFDLRTESFSADVSSYFRSIGISTAKILGTKKDKLGNFWFNAGADGLFHYHSATKKTFHLKLGSKLTDHTIALSAVSDVQVFGNQAYVLHFDGSFECIDVQRLKIVSRSKVFKTGEPVNSKRRFFFIDNSGALWVWAGSDQDGLIYFHPRKGIQKTLTKENGSLNNNVVTGAVQDERNQIWVATDHGGINIVEPNHFKLIVLNHKEDDVKTIGQNSISTIFRDSNGIIWAGTYKKGISYYSKDIIKFSLFRHSPSAVASLPYDDVNRFVEDERGNLWIGTNGGGLIYFNRKERSYTTYRHQAGNPNSLSNDVVVSLFIDEHKKLWIGTYFGGLDSFDGKRFVNYRHDPKNNNSLADDRIWDITADDTGNLWIATMGGGIDVLNKQRTGFQHYRAYSSKNSISSNFVSSLFKDKHGNAYIGTSLGLDFWDKKTGKFKHFAADPNKKNALSNANVFDILEDKAGFIWVTTRDGLNRYDPNTNDFTVFRMEDGLASNTTLSILEDHNGDLWLSTTKGLTFVKVHRKRGNITYSFRNYDQHDGLQGQEFNVNSAQKLRSGELIFGGANGFNLFRPSDIKVDHAKPTLVLSELQIANKTVEAGQEVDGQLILASTLSTTNNLSLNYNNNVIAISFTALNYSNPNKIKYRYLLEGFDKTWQEPSANTRRANYTNLDPGTYVFRVSSTNVAGSWVNNEQKLKIVISPPIWKTPLAYLLYVAVVGGALLFIRRRGVEKLNKEFALRQERSEAKRMHELDLMKIKFFTNVSHEFRTPLSLIITPMDKLIHQTVDDGKKQQLLMIQRNGKRLLNMVNQLLDFRKMEVNQLKLDAKVADLVGFIKDLIHSFDDIAEKKNIDLHFKSEIAALPTTFDHDKVERIFFNLLSNAFKFTPQHGMVTVTIKLEETDQSTQALLISVADNGIGIAPDKLQLIFERFFQNDIPGSFVNQGSGIGLSITKEFVTMHGGNIYVESVLGQGSVFTVRLPIISSTSKTTADLNFSIRPVEKKLVVESSSTVDLLLTKQPTILLVEDNQDFLFYLEENLSEYFRVVKAANGKEGWQKVLSIHPDLVVSDVSMPEMNGIDLCRKIKEDQRTADIPVILLTALTAEDSQLSGLTTGASNYVMKPFNFEILHHKIKNQLRQVELVKSKYKKQVHITPEIDEIESVDQKFMRQLATLIERNLSNADYSVEQLSREMNTSRVSLYKKVLVLTGKTPIAYIRFYRLTKAAGLLEQSQLTISEIAYQVGFNNPKFFSKYFKSEFNMLPSAYAAKKGKKDEG